MQDLSGFSVPKGFRGGNAIKVQLWWAVQATIFAWSPQVLYRWRAFLLRLFGAKIGKNVVIRPSVKITYPWKLTLGDYAKQHAFLIVCPFILRKALNITR